MECCCMGMYGVYSYMAERPRESEHFARMHSADVAAKEQLQRSSVVKVL